MSCSLVHIHFHQPHLLIVILCFDIHSDVLLADLSLCVFVGDGGDYIVISLTEGGIAVGINLGSGMFETEVKPRKGHIRFDDNQWHKVIVTRESREVM